MHIECVEAIVLEFPLDPALVRHPLFSQRGGSSSREAVILRLTASDGAKGQAYFTQLGVPANSVAKQIDCYLREILLDQGATDIAKLWRRLFAATRTSYWSRPELTRAIALIDAALWDLAGNRQGKLVADLWGRQHDAVPVVAMANPWPADWSDTDCLEEIEQLVSDGFMGIKIKVGAFSSLDIAGDAERVKAIRRAMGPDFVIIADANQGWSLEEATAFGRAVEGQQLAWIEEPCHWENDVADLVRLRRLIGTPVAAGQMDITPWACKSLIERQAVDVCNFDVAVGCGPTAWMSVAEFAAAHNVQMAQHMEPHVGIHLLATISNGTHVEMYPTLADPFYAELVVSSRKPSQGYMTLPNGTGWGLEMDEQFIRNYRTN